MTELSAEAKNLNWLVQSFAEKVPGVNEAVVVSSDGLPIATSAGLDRDAADRFAAVASVTSTPSFSSMFPSEKTCSISLSAASPDCL